MDKNKEIVDKNFDKIITLVEEGCSIVSALKIAKISRNFFYKNASEKQKAELLMAKKSYRLVNTGNRYLLNLES